MLLLASMPPYTVPMYLQLEFSVLLKIFFGNDICQSFLRLAGALMEYFLERSPIDFDLSTWSPLMY